MGTRKGLSKYIEEPQTIKEWFDEYRAWCKSNPRIVYEYHGKDGEERMKPLERPLTHEGFLNFCYEQKGCDINRYYYNVGDSYDDYVSIVTRVKEIIRQDQIEGGVVGQYNSNLTARLNGLVDKKETEVKGEPRIFNLE